MKGKSNVSGILVTVISVLLMGYFALTMISTLQPQIGNLTLPAGGITQTIFELAQDWFVPIICIGVVLFLVKKVMGK